MRQGGKEGESRRLPGGERWGCKGRLAGSLVMRGWPRALNRSAADCSYDGTGTPSAPTVKSCNGDLCGCATRRVL